MSDSVLEETLALILRALRDLLVSARMAQSAELMQQIGDHIAALESSAWRRVSKGEGG